MASVQTAPFDELIEALRHDGLSGAAESLTQLRGAAWTTSSEMLGELGRPCWRWSADRPQHERPIIGYPLHA
jgi:hypothetical protein